jgi:hypothetical protein
MKGELAQVAVKYLQQKQYVYVSGCLCSYNMINHVRYKVSTRIFNPFNQIGITWLLGFM